MVVFLTGDGGDMTQVDNRNPYQIKQFGETAIRLVGGRSAPKRLRCCCRCRGATWLAVGAESKVLKSSVACPGPSEWPGAWRLSPRTSKSVDATEWTFAKEILLLDLAEHKRPVAQVEVQAIQVGPAMLLSCPAEYFCQSGLDIRAGQQISADVSGVAGQRLHRLRADRRSLEPGGGRL